MDIYIVKRHCTKFHAFFHHESEMTIINLTIMYYVKDWKCIITICSLVLRRGFLIRCSILVYIYILILCIYIVLDSTLLYYWGLGLLPNQLLQMFSLYTPGTHQSLAITPSRTLKMLSLASFLAYMNRAISSFYFAGFHFYNPVTF